MTKFVEVKCYKCLGAGIIKQNALVTEPDGRYHWESSIKTCPICKGKGYRKVRA